MRTHNSNSDGDRDPEHPNRMLSALCRQFFESLEQKGLLHRDDSDRGAKWDLNDWDLWGLGDKDV